MERYHKRRAFAGRWSTAVRAGWVLITVLMTILGGLGWMLALPLKAGRLCVATGEWALRSFVACVLGLIGLLILGPLIFSLAYMLLYPWLH